MALSRMAAFLFAAPLLQGRNTARLRIPTGRASGAATSATDQPQGKRNQGDFVTSSTPIRSTCRRRPPRAGCWAVLSSAVLSSVVLALGVSGCSVKRMAVDTQAEIMQEAFPVVEEQTDYEYARLAAAGNLMQIEGL